MIENVFKGVRRGRSNAVRPTPVELDVVVLHEAIGKRIQQRRILRGISQEALGAAIGVTGGAVSRIESGDNGLTTENALKLCQVLGFDIGELLNA